MDFSTNNSRDSNKINPYDILGVKPNFTLDELRTRFKELSRVYHPDKGGTRGLYDQIFNSYRTLCKVYKIRLMQESQHHHQLRERHEQFEQNDEFRDNNFNQMEGMREQLGVDARNAPNGFTVDRERGIPGSAAHGFNVAQFNNQFGRNQAKEENELQTAMAKGYGDSMAASSKVREDFNPKPLKGGFTSDRFNNAFDKQPINNKNLTLMKRQNPDEMMLSSLGYVDMKNNSTNDFSGANNTLKKLNFSDYMLAHNTSKLVDTNHMKQRESFSTIGELEASRYNDVPKINQ